MKKIILSAVLGLFASQSFAQDTYYAHSVGATYLIGIYQYTYEESITDPFGNTTTVSGSESAGMGYPGLTYNARLDFKLKKELSFSITSYPTICLNVSANSRSGVSEGSSAAFEIPTGVQLNFGHHSTTRSRKSFGGYGMLGYNFGAYSGIGTIHSITAQAGIKFEFKDQSLGLRLQYNLPVGGLEKGEKLMMFGGGVLYNFSMK